MSEMTAVKALKTIESIVGNVEHKGGGANAAKLYADMLNDIRSLVNSALSAQVQDVAGWQTIDTAPKDGSQFLAFGIGDYFNCWWHENSYGEQYWMDEADSEPNPSHWMPLPPPPASPTK